jgi:thioredoxin 1
MDKKKLLFRILVPVLIAITITAIWIVKTHPTPTIMNEDTVKSEDFVLAASSVNLDELKEYSLPIIIDFGSDSCIPCQQMAPVLETMNEEMQGKVIIKFVDVWKYQDAATDFPVQVIPTQVIFDSEGKPYTPSEDIEIEFTMYSSKDTGEHVYTVHQGGLTEEQMRKILKDMGVE